MKTPVPLTLVLTAAALCQCSPYVPQGEVADSIAGGATDVANVSNDIPPTGTAPTPPPTATDYPVASRSTNPNRVISPFPPHNVIDITGFKSGDLARDPGNRKIFRVP